VYKARQYNITSVIYDSSQTFKNANKSEQTKHNKNDTAKHERNVLKNKKNILTFKNAIITKAEKSNVLAIFHSNM
jgi:hypothetical protein